jgi:hypothetical protein
MQWAMGNGQLAIFNFCLLFAEGDLLIANCQLQAYCLLPAAGDLPIACRRQICQLPAAGDLPIASRRRIANCQPQAICILHAVGKFANCQPQAICLLWRLPNILEEAENKFRLEDKYTFIYKSNKRF